MIQYKAGKQATMLQNFERKVHIDNIVMYLSFRTDRSEQTV